MTTDLICAFGKQAVEASELPTSSFRICPYAVAATLVLVISSGSPSLQRRHGYGAKRGGRSHGGRCGHERLRRVFGEAAAYRKGYGSLPGLAGQFLPAAARDELGYSS